MRLNEWNFILKFGEFEGTILVGDFINTHVSLRIIVFKISHVMNVFFTHLPLLLCALIDMSPFVTTVQFIFISETFLSAATV